jgi:peptide/nickel transport system substrate-binding protein
MGRTIHTDTTAYVPSGIRRRRRGLSRSLALVVAVAALVGATAAGAVSSRALSSGAGAATQPEFRVGIIGAGLDTLNPFNAFTAVDFAAFMQMYPSLVQFTSDLKPRPDLATSWSTSPDGKRWTFKIRSNGAWTDGEKITAADAAFTINTAVKFKGGVAAGLSPFLLGVRGATAPNPTTLVITLDHPVPALLANMFQLPMLPEHVWKPLAAGKGAKLKTLTNDPSRETVVVAGPFTVRKLDLKGTTLFTPVDTFYGQKPLIQGFGWQLFTNPDAAVQALKTGQVDVIFPVPAAAAASLKSNSKLEVKGLSKLPLMFAVNDSANNTKHSELRDVQVRQALSLAVDRKQIAREVYRGYATPGGSVLYPEYAPRFMSKPLPAPARNVARANAILDSLGYTRGGGGTREANGHPMRYTVLLWSAMAGDQQRVFGVLKQNLAEIGVALESKISDNPLGLFIGKNGKYADSDIWLPPFVGNPDPDSGLVLFTSGLLGAVNPTGVSNPAYDKLFAQETKETNPAKRKLLIDKAIAMLQSQQMEMPLVYFQQVAAWDKRWQNVPDVGSVFYTPTYISKTAYIRLRVK